MISGSGQVHMCVKSDRPTLVAGRQEFVKSEDAGESNVQHHEVMSGSWTTSLLIELSNGGRVVVWW